MISLFKHIYIIIPLLILILAINLGFNKKTTFIIVLSSVIFIAGILRILLQNKTEIEPRISDRSNRAVMKLSNMKWKFDSSINRYHCFSCKKMVKITQTTCSKCINKITTCLICRLPFKERSKIVDCEICKYQFHKNHWNLWIDYKGSCPNCKTKYKTIVN